MKKLLFAFVTSLLLLSCDCPEHRQLHLVKNQLFYQSYGGSLRICLVIDTNKNGVYFTMNSWLLSSVEFISKERILNDESFKPLRLVSKHELETWDETNINTLAK